MLSLFGWSKRDGIDLGASEKKLPEGIWIHQNKGYIQAKQFF
jgi:hypothetical protein